MTLVDVALDAPPRAFLDVRDLVVHFPTEDGLVRAVDGVTFTLERGKTLAIVGESGCGKSVTAMSILRLIPEPPGKIAGAIRFNGKNLLACSEPEMRGRMVTAPGQEATHRPASTIRSMPKPMA